jgi:hypothetical protein
VGIPVPGVSEVDTGPDGDLARPTDPSGSGASWCPLRCPFDGRGGGPILGGASAVNGDIDGSPDPYGAATAEFYELLATAHWDRTGPELAGLLAGVDPGDGPIVDVGAGTGIGIPYLLAAVPGAEVLAIEPSRAMRTALHTRLLLAPELEGRVTVDPRPVGDALPDRACAVVLSAVLGHLTEAECDALWRFAAERMPAGAPMVVEVLPPHRPESIDPVRYGARPVGRFVYEGWQSGEPVDERTMRWSMRYRVLDGDRVVADETVRSTYRCWSPDDVRAAVTPYGLTATAHGDAVVLRRP